MTIDPPSGGATRVVLHLTPDAVDGGFLDLDEPDRAAERLPELVARFGRGDPSELDELRGLAARAAVAPLYETCTPDPVALAYLRELNVATFRDGFRPPDLLAYLALDFTTADEARRFAALAVVEGDAGRRFPGGVDDAYLEPVVLAGTGDPGLLRAATCSADVMGQRYLGPAPVGLNVDGLGPFPGADGAGVRLYDLEIACGPTHAAVPPPALAQIGGSTASAVHHLGVMGVIRAHRPVAPAVAYGHACPFDAHGCVNHAAACASALARLGPGDVLLYEYSVEHGSPATDEAPPECAPAVYWLIAAATRRVDPFTGASLGVHVVAAGGNGRWEMDRLTGSFVRPNVPARTVLGGDSGAVVVGAADALDPHRRWRTSNHGDRVDCYAWGEKLMTATKFSTGGVAHDAFTCEFGETSGAAAQVAGAVAALQGIAHAAGHGPIDPLMLRALLGDPSLGTPVYAFDAAAIPHGGHRAGGRGAASAGPPIGSMPDLGRVAARLLGG